MALIPLADARAKAARLTAQRIDGVDPAAARAKARSDAAALRSRVVKARVRFAQVFEEYIRDNGRAWSSPKHAENWRAQMHKHALPTLEGMPVSAITVDDILAVLRPIWFSVPETAGRIRMRLERVLDYARVRGHREGDNPARWRGNLEHILPAQGKIARVQHFAAIAWRALPAFDAELRGMDLVTARALRFIILTACRTMDALGSTWSEIDRDERTWTIPPERMKSRRAHRVPLSDPALSILDQLAILGTEPFRPIFPNRGGGFYSNVALLALLRRLGKDSITVHGMRSTFRDWVSERTDYRAEIAEAALAHVVSDAVIAAYSRTDFFEKRRALMRDWAVFVTSGASL
jgi:integrase